MKRGPKLSDLREHRRNREAEKAGLIGPPRIADERPTCCSKALYGGCEHQKPKGRWADDCEPDDIVDE